MSETKTVKLKYPIEVPTSDGEGIKKIEELTFGRLKAKHLRSLPDNFMEKDGKLSGEDLIPIIAALADISKEEVDEIDVIEDLPEVAETLQDFLGKSL